MEFAMRVAIEQKRVTMHFYTLLLVGIKAETLQCMGYRQLYFHLIPEALKPDFETYSCKLWEINAKQLYH